MKTLDEFVSAFRARLRGELTESYSLRKLAPSDLGMEVDRQDRRIKEMLREMYLFFQPERPLDVKAPTTPAQAAQPVNGTNGRKQ